MKAIAKKGLEEVKEKRDPESIVSTMNLDTIQLKSKRWKGKIWVSSTLPKSYRFYNIKLYLNEQPYLDRIAEVEEKFETSLLSQSRDERKKHREEVKELRYDLENLRGQCEEIEFTATVEELKYKDSNTCLLITMPDDVIEAFNRQKTRFELYEIVLTPR